MKQKDIAVIIAVVFFSIIISYFVATKFISTPADRQQQVEVAPVIDTKFTQPSSAYFNPQAVDPTQLIQIGNNSNQSPFSGSSTP